MVYRTDPGRPRLGRSDPVRWRWWRETLAWSLYPRLNVQEVMLCLAPSRTPLESEGLTEGVPSPMIRFKGGATPSTARQEASEASTRDPSVPTKTVTCRETTD